MHIVNQNKQEAKKRSKCWYDRNVKLVSYEEGEHVLLLLPLIGKPLQAKYFDPYVVAKRLSEVDYLVKTPTDVSRCESFLSTFSGST